MNQLLVITGGSKGIGKAIIEKFMANGFDVITCSRNDTDLLRLQTKMNQKFSGQHLFYQKADLSIRADVNAFIEYVHSFKRPVTTLVNNTGIFIPGQIHNEEEGVFEKSIETNLYSAYHVTRGLVDEMIKRRNGHIFTICSTASIMAYPNGGSYCISKFALLGMTKVLREELKPYQVKVTAILPGATYTDSWKGSELPIERFMNVTDVAEAVWAANSLSARSVIEEILIRPQLGDLG